MKSKSKSISQIPKHILPSKLQYPHTLHVKDVQFQNITRKEVARMMEWKDIELKHGLLEVTWTSCEVFLH